MLGHVGASRGELFFFTADHFAVNWSRVQTCEDICYRDP